MRYMTEYGVQKYCGKLKECLVNLKKSKYFRNAKIVKRALYNDYDAEMGNYLLKW